MPTIPGEALAPGPGRGSAYILGRTGPDALSILINGQRAREAAAARAAAERVKAQDADYKDWNARLSGLNNATGPTYQRYASQQRNILDQKLQGIYVDPKMSRQEKSFQANNLIDQAGIALAAGKQIDEQNAKIKADYGNDKEINQELFWKDLHAKQFQPLPDGSGPDLANPVAPLDYDQTTPETLLNDRKYLNIPVLYKNLATNLTPKQTVQQAAGGKPGTMSTTYSNEVRFWKKNADGSLYRNKEGDMEMDVTDGLLEHALGNERIKRDLQGLMAEHQALTKSGEAKMAAYEPLTAEERQALAVEPTMKDLLGRRLTEQALANHHETQRYNRYPRPAAAAGKPKYTPNPVTSYDGGVVGADVQTGETQTDTPVFIGGTGELAKPRMNQEQHPVIQQGFHSAVRRPQPTYSTPTNPAKTYMFTGLPVAEVIRPGKNGALEVTPNNKNGLFGIPQQGVTIFRNRKTGAVEMPPNNEADHDARLAKLGPDWKLEPAVQVAVPVNKNYANEVGPALARLEAREKQKAEMGNGYVPKTTDELESEAFKLAAGGTETQYVPYNTNTSGNIDAHTGGAYREFGTKIVPAKERQIRAKAAAPKPKADPLGFTPKPVAALKAATATTTHKAKANPLGF